MKTFEYKGDSFAVIDGELWVKLPAATPPISEAPKARRTRRSKTPKNNVMLSEVDTKGRLEQATIANIKQMINAGYPNHEIANKYGVTVNYLYTIRFQMKKKGELTLTESTSEQVLQ